MDELFSTLAAAQGRVVIPATQPEKGYIYRADHFEFFKEGIPCLYPNGGKEVLAREPGYGRSKSDEYTAQHYHQPSDRIDATWDLGRGGAGHAASVRGRVPGGQRGLCSGVERRRGLQTERLKWWLVVCRGRVERLVSVRGWRGRMVVLWNCRPGVRQPVVFAGEVSLPPTS